MRKEILTIILTLSIFSLILIVLFSRRLTSQRTQYSFQPQNIAPIPSHRSQDTAQSIAREQGQASSVLQKTLKLVNYQWKVVPEGEKGQGHTASKNETKEKYLIYLCDKVTSCGGWGDRQRGFINAYLLAYLTGRRFGINMTVPCNLTRFYVPNVVNWIVREDEIRGKSTRYIHAMGQENKYSFHYNLTTIDFNEEYPEDVVFLRTNVEHFWTLRQNPRYNKKLPPWLKHGRPRFFEDAWHWLMKPTPELRDLAIRLLRDWGWFSRTKPLVCAHVRIGTSKFNPDDTRKVNDIRKLGALWDFLEAHANNGSNVFIASDNPTVRETSRQRFGAAHRDTGGVIAHVDKERDGEEDVDWGGACQGLRDALLDQLLLTLCDVLVTTNSNFSYRSVLIRANIKGLYFFANGKLKKMDIIK